MFGKKKNEPVMNWAESKMHDLYIEWGEALNTLWNKPNRPTSKQKHSKSVTLQDLTAKARRKTLKPQNTACCVRLNAMTVPLLKLSDTILNIARKCKQIGIRTFAQATNKLNLQSVKFSKEIKKRVDKHKSL